MLSTMNRKGLNVMSRERPELEARLHENITLYATYVRRSTQKVSCNFIKEPTVLLKNISLNKGMILADHIWIKLKDIKNNITGLPLGSRLYLTGTVYAYYNESKKKVLSAKYSIKDVNIITIDGIPLARTA